MQRSSLWNWLSPLLSAAIIVAVVYRYRSMDMAHLKAVVPKSPLFWLVFIIYYFTPVLTDYAIFRRLWQVPTEALIALTRKMVMNEIVLGYIGEVYFYSWARKKVDMTTSPFGAVKDVAILSAVVTNFCTLAMILAAWPLISTLPYPNASRTIAVSMGVLILLSMVPILLGNRLFTLSRRPLWVISALQFTRIFVTTLLVAIAWALALPDVALHWWVTLATLKLLISRLPLVPQKDVLLAAAATAVVGNDLQIGVLMTFMAAIILATHMILGAGLAIADFVTVDRGTNPASEV